MTVQTFTPVAVIKVDDRQDSDVRLHALALELVQYGVNAAGCAQRRFIHEKSGVEMLALHDIRSRQSIQISQFLGNGAEGCKLDPQALAEYAGILLTQLQEGADLLMINRFGKAEAEGGGLRAVISSAIERGIPALIPVREKYRDALLAFADGLAVEVEPTLRSLSTWRNGPACDPQMACRRSSPPQN